ncbi:carbonic anhydrase [Candidatus Halobonum tyrrellensis]|uniref:carbonic anhydrase n=1 Tax=Candidatus Halobonum tyrrellensis G22 TaxID=1324957 RepID=V4HD91_9EURY|nr:carbonic anhydrase [Candidatus Halobonum tyrrellensis]ESP88685.1 carbonic anhydrase [Candidatus Halobonum tyrrellensis G22]
MRRPFVDLLEANLEHAAEFDARFDGVQESQHPDVVTVCCSDSRVLQDHLWGNDEPGHVFTCANIGNRVVQRTDAGEAVSGDVLYPLAHTGTEAVVVVGHTGCGAVTAAYDRLTDEDENEDAADASEPAGITHCLDLLTPRLEPGVDRLPAGLDRADAVNRLVEYNVDRQVAFLRESDEVPGDTGVVGVVYDFQDAYSGRRGEVHVVNVDGERSVETLRVEHPDVESRIERLWEH